MTKEDKELLKDLSARLPYEVKILHTGWDYDGDTDFDTVETLIGIDDRFIYTVWDKTGDREKHCLSIFNWKPYLRPLSSMTEEELYEVQEILGKGVEIRDVFISIVDSSINTFSYLELQAVFDWFNAHHFDYRGLIEKNLAIEVTEENNPYANIKQIIKQIKK